MAQTFSHRLMLAIQLINTTTGQPIGFAGSAVYKDKKPIQPLIKQDGVILLISNEDFGESFELDIRAYGCEPKTITVNTSELNRQLPMLTVHLLPKTDFGSPFKCVGLDGFTEGITEVDAVRAGESSCLAREWEPRKKLLTVFNPHRLNLDRMWYALVDPDTQTYEVFQIVKRISDTVFKLDRALKTEPKNYFPICPLILGEASSNGSYMLRLPDDSSHPKWIVRKVCGEAVSFETLDPTAKPPPDDSTGGDE